MFLSKRSKYENITDKFEHLLTALFLNTSPFLIVGMPERIDAYAVRIDRGIYLIGSRDLRNGLAHFAEGHEATGVEHRILMIYIEVRGTQITLDPQQVTQNGGYIDVLNISGHGRDAQIPVVGTLYRQLEQKKIGTIGGIRLIEAKPAETV